MVVYFSKSEQDTLQALPQLEREVKNHKLKTREVMHKITHVFANESQVSVQEV